MKKFVVLMLALASLGAMTGCDDDNKNSVKVPVAVQNAFGQMFPNVGHVEWSGKGGYMVADFRDGGTDMQAWFDAGGKWYMTEEDVLYARLPQAIRSAFESGEYAAWRVDDVDKLMREGLETIYVLEVEQGQQEFDLFYSEDGVLVQATADTDRDEDGDHEDMLPQELSQAIKDFIAQKYPGSRIVDAEHEKGNFEVEIVDGRTSREVCFGEGDVWLWTKTEVRSSEVPPVVMQTLQASQYAGWEIDEVEHYDGSDREWYLFDLEDPQSDREMQLKIQADGAIF